MSDAEFRMFCQMLREHCGLHFAAESRFLLEKRLARRVEALELGSFAAYHYQLRAGSDNSEMSRVIDDLTTNETYFFREYKQLRALIDEILPEHLLQRRTHNPAASVSIWSAGCSSGEEPYTTVMMALEAGLEPGRDIRVYASDISRAMLQKARRGVYREASFRETPSHLRDKYFIEKDGLFRICDEVKKHVDFIHLNLLDDGKLALLGSMDVILCRNVIIYFDAEIKKRVIDTFHDKLRPGGHLLLGHSESLINLSTAFELRHLTNELVYRRPIPGEEVRDPWHQAAETALATADGGER
ncbi:MAG: protein-glutamate O-methyltransferase CheR [Proteobacteria bacterium]|nr:protein-glutamate O-methyltransferase CheR [Pseudomonadota bacterium]MCZ6781748.1 protein-glutamate O-methyltransferase CheR [Pseudomonadota bacterium]